MWTNPDCTRRWGRTGRLASGTGSDRCSPACVERPRHRREICITDGSFQDQLPTADGMEALKAQQQMAQVVEHAQTEHQIEMAQGLGRQIIDVHLVERHARAEQLARTTPKPVAVLPSAAITSAPRRSHSKL